METFSKSENKQERIEKEKVLEMLRVNGFEHPETKSMVIAWTEQQEALVSKEKTARVRICFEIERSDLYVAIDDMDDALECLEDARMLASQEGEMELYRQIMNKMGEVDKMKF